MSREGQDGLCEHWRCKLQHESSDRREGREEAIKAATSIWDLFGEGNNLQSLRPLGKEVIVDGLDIGNYLMPWDILIN